LCASGGGEEAHAMTARAKAKATDAAAGKAPAYTRRYPRFAIDVRMQVKMFQAGEFRSCWGRSTELGQDGIGATLTGNLEPGEIVTLEIPLPLSPYPLKVRAIVRYGQGLHYGFEFLTLNDNQRDTIRRVCQMLATKA
jgi:PilZ domain